MQVDPVLTYNTPDASMVSSRSETTDKMDFLAMLTAQLQNQDPLSPLEGHEYASQLATFSQLQELEEMNSNLASALDANLLLAQSINNNMATSLIGRNVRAQVNQVVLDSSGDDVPIRYDLTESASSVTIEISDADGDVVRTLNLTDVDGGTVESMWDGRDDNGYQLAAGQYSYNISAVNSSGEEISVDNYFEIEGEVTAVNYVDGQVTLTVNGYDVYLGQITSILGDNSGDDSKQQG